MHDETLLVSCSYAGTVERFAWTGSRRTGSENRSGFEPLGVAISPDGRTAYVALSMAAAVAVVDLERTNVTTIPVGRWPRYLALSPDGARLAVDCNGDRAIAVVDTQHAKMLFLNEFGGINAGHMQISADGQWVYVPWMIYRHNPINERNVQPRLGAGLAHCAAAHGRASAYAKRSRSTTWQSRQRSAWARALAATGNGCTHRIGHARVAGLSAAWLAVSIDRRAGRSYRSIAARRRSERFYRVPLGGRPMGLRLTKDGRQALVANYLSNGVQVVDLERRELARVNRRWAGRPSLRCAARRSDLL